MKPPEEIWIEWCPPKRQGQIVPSVIWHNRPQNDGITDDICYIKADIAEQTEGTTPAYAVKRAKVTKVGVVDDGEQRKADEELIRELVGWINVKVDSENRGCYEFPHSKPKELIARANGRLKEGGGKHVN